MIVLLIGENGEKIGKVSIEEAEEQARLAGKDLMLVAENTYKIADEGKLKYDRNKQKKKQRSTQRTHKVKEIKLSPLTGSHDLEVKSRHIKEFLKKGMKTKITMRFKGRQMAFKGAGLEKMNGLIAPFIDSELATVDKMPRFEGRNLITFLIPRKE